MSLFFYTKINLNGRKNKDGGDGNGGCGLGVVKVSWMEGGGRWEKYEFYLKELFNLLFSILINNF